LRAVEVKEEHAVVLDEHLEVEEVEQDGRRPDEDVREG
jgi:hypothetical protein